MLTPASNQYLRPEYLNPLPTTLDAKKSPLALLAQTCSAIGADTPNPKLISAAEKASLKSNHKYSESARDKSPIVTSVQSECKASFKPYESCLTTREKTRSPEDANSSSSRVRTPGSSKGSAANTPLQVRCNSAQSVSSQRNSPQNLRKTPSERTSPLGDTPTNLKLSEQRPASATNHKSSESKDKSHSSKTSQQATLSSSSYLSGLPAAGFPLPMDLMTSGLLAAQHNALKNGLHPYLAYSRLKGPNTTECRDPFCTGCSLSSNLMNGLPKVNPPCPAGCSQCDHTKGPYSLPSTSQAAAAYAHAQLAAMAAASQLPYVCSWVTGDSVYCGKRFSTSEEMLQHLRTHTTSMNDSNTSTLNMLSAAGLHPTHPLLQRSYPTPPLSPLTPRFHPYSKPPHHMLTSPTLPFPLPTHPSLAAYFPSYPLFGPRNLHP